MEDNKRERIPAALAAILLAALACSIPTAGPRVQPAGGPDANLTAAVETAFAQAALTMTQVANGNAPPPVPGASATPSQTPPPSETPTPSVPLVWVSVDTNCRVGPGKVYDYLGALRVGQTAEVVARNPGGDYWYVHNPDRPNEFCWVWGQYATLAGNTSQLPVFTPPPTPTPPAAFVFSYKSIGIGPGFQCLQFNVKNSGTVTWESFKLTVHDVTQGIKETDSGDDFTEYDQWCGSTASQPALAAGMLGVASVQTHLTSNPAGDHFEVSLTLCTLNGLAGQCLTHSIAFDY
jgi:hypothetical protein